MITRKLALPFLLIVAMIAPSEKVVAIDPGSVTTVFSLVRTAMDLLGGDPQGAFIAGNRELLLGIHKKLQNMEERQKWVQDTLSELPEEFTAILDEHDAKGLINKLRVHILELEQHEELFELETRNDIRTAWNLHRKRLRVLRESIHNTLNWLKVPDNPVLMAARAAAYGMLLQVQGQIIAIERMMLSIDDSITQSMGFLDDAIARQRQYALEVDVRYALAQEAQEEMRKLLKGPLLVEVDSRIALLRGWHERNGTVHDWFPDWPTVVLPSNQPIEKGIRTIAALLKRHCSHGTYVGSATRWLWTLVYGTNTLASPKQQALGRAEQTEQECGLQRHVLTRMRFLPYLPETVLNSIDDQHQALWRFRTPVYKRVVKHTPGIERFLFLPDDSDTYLVESRQYEVSIESLEIRRTPETQPGKERWGPEPRRLPGLDMMSYWVRLGPQGEPDGRASIPERLYLEFNRPITFVSDRRDFWWEAVNGFEVHYVHLHDIRKKMDAQQRSVRNQMMVWRDHNTDLFINTVCFVSLSGPESKLSKAITKEVDEVQRLMKRLPETEIVPGDFCAGPIYAVHWSPKPPESAAQRLDVKQITEPESWATMHNRYMRSIEFLFRVHAEVERSYVGFRDFPARLDAGDEPELEWVVHPGNVAALVAKDNSPAVEDRIAKLLAQDELGNDIDTWIHSVIERTGDRIRDENNRQVFASRLRLALAIAELTHEYAAPILEQVGPEEHGQEVQEVEIDIEHLDEDNLHLFLKQLEQTSEVQTPQGQSEGADSPQLPDLPDEEGLLRSTPILDLVGGLSLAKVGVVAVRSGGKIVARLWLNRHGARKTTLLLENLQKRAILGNNKEAVVSIDSSAIESSDRLQKAMVHVNTAVGKRLRDLQWSEKLKFNQVLELGKRFVCGGMVTCVARLKESKYGGVVLRQGTRQFRIGNKSGAGMQANFESLVEGSRANVHYNLVAP